MTKKNVKLMQNHFLIKIYQNPYFFNVYEINCFVLNPDLNEQRMQFTNFIDHFTFFLPLKSVSESSEP